MAFLCITILFILMARVSPIKFDEDGFLRLKCGRAILFHTQSPECDEYLLRHSSTPQSISTSRPSIRPTTVNLFTAIITAPANTSTIIILPTPSTSHALANWAKVFISILSGISSLYGAIVAFLRYKLGWGRRRAFSLGLVRGQPTQRVFRCHASSIPLPLILGSPSASI